MEKDLKYIGYPFDLILDKPFLQCVGLVWKINKLKELTIKGKIINTGPIDSKQKFIYRNPNVMLSQSFDSKKIFKTSLELYSQETLNIIPSLTVTSDYSSNAFSNTFSLSYTKDNYKLVFKLLNTKMNLYHIYKKYNFGVANEISLFSDNRIKYNHRFAVWWKTDYKKILLRKEYDGEISVSMYYKTLSLNEIAAKVLALNKNVQMLVGIKYALTDAQKLRLRLHSDGVIGVELVAALSQWVRVCTSSEISVKELAKSQNVFLGFGLKFDINYKD